MRISCNLRAPIIGALAVLLVCGCAGRRAGGDRSNDDEPRRANITLPGQNRVLPSADPRNASTNLSGPIGSPEQPTAPPTEPSTATPPADQGALGDLHYQVQVLATGDRQKADRLRDRLFERLGLPVSVEPQLGLWKVRVGMEPARATAESLRHRLVGLGYEDAFVVVVESR